MFMHPEFKTEPRGVSVFGSYEEYSPDLLQSLKSSYM